MKADTGHGRGRRGAVGAFVGSRRRDVPGTEPMRAGRRAYTLMELVVVLAVGSVLILVIIGWITALSATSATNLEQNASGGGVTYLATTAGADITGAVVCDPNGFGVPLESISSNSSALNFGLYVPNTSTGFDDLVLWRWSATTGSLQRAVIAGTSSSCPTDSTPSTDSWVTVISYISSASVTPWYQGVAGTIPSSGLCNGAAGTSSDPTNCYFDSLELKATVVNTSGQGSSTAFDQSWNLNLSGSKVTP